MTIENQKNQKTLPWRTQGIAREAMAAHTVANIKFALVCVSPAIVSTPKGARALLKTGREHQLATSH